MTGYEFCGSYWWLFPLVMIFFCFLFMRGCSARRMCGFWPQKGPDESALAILNNRYAKGEIDQREYEEKKGGITESVNIGAPPKIKGENNECGKKQ